VRIDPAGKGIKNPKPGPMSETFAQIRRQTEIIDAQQSVVVILVLGASGKVAAVVAPLSSSARTGWKAGLRAGFLPLRRDDWDGHGIFIRRAAADYISTAVVVTGEASLSLDATKGFV
jgi:hypothetical protein